MDSQFSMDFVSCYLPMYSIFALVATMSNMQIMRFQYFQKGLVHIATRTLHNIHTTGYNVTQSVHCHSLASLNCHSQSVRMC
jgi:hypothetical protein